MEQDIQALNTRIESDQQRQEQDTGDVQMLDGIDEPTLSGTVTAVQPDMSLPDIDPAILKPDQQQAFDIIISHLEETLSGANPPPL